MKASDSIFNRLPLLFAIAYIVILYTAAWVLGVDNHAVIILIGFLAGDIYRSNKGDDNESK